MDASFLVHQIIYLRMYSVCVKSQLSIIPNIFSEQGTLCTVPSLIILTSESSKIHRPCSISYVSFYLSSDANPSTHIFPMQLAEVEHKNTLILPFSSSISLHDFEPVIFPLSASVLKNLLEISLLVHRLRLCTPNARGQSLIPGGGTNAATKIKDPTLHNYSQINKYKE